MVGHGIVGSAGSPIILAAIGVLLLVATVAPVAAADPGSAAHARRETAAQVVKCMKKRMAADRYLSYNQASRDCHEALLKGSGSEALMAATRPSPSR